LLIGAILPTGLRADFAAFLSAARAVLGALAGFLTVRVAVFWDPFAAFADDLLMATI
jgi:hypothetical protein